jgi:hypothetical protein
MFDTIEVQEEQADNQQQSDSCCHSAAGCVGVGCNSVLVIQNCSLAEGCIEDPLRGTATPSSGGTRDQWRLAWLAKQRNAGGFQHRQCGPAREGSKASTFLYTD